MKNQIQKIFTSKKIILSILGVFVIGLLCCLSIKKSEDTDDLALVTFREGYKKNCLAGYMIPQRFNMLKNHVRNYTAYTDCVCSIADEFSTEDMNFIIQNGEDVFMQTPRGANLFKQTLEKCEGL